MDRRVIDMLSIDEAIAEFKENDLCQIAELLEELKARRESDRTSDSKPFDVLLAQRYNKAIDDAKDVILQTLDNEILVDTLHLRLEQLKAGGNDEMEK